MDIDLDSIDFEKLGKPGRRALPLSAEVVRNLEEADIALLEADRETKAAPLQRLTERHHQLARYIAENKTMTECSYLTGYGLSRISILKADSSFQELIAHYTKVAEAEIADFNAELKATSRDALNAIRELLENNELSTTQLMKLIELTADRAGHGPQSTANVKVTADIGDRLDAARKRIAEKRALQVVEDIPYVEVKDIN